MKSAAFAAERSLVLAPLVLTGATEAARPKPTLRVDSTSVGDGPSGRVTNYADVVGPVQ